jgi:hypothetical protein
VANSAIFSKAFEEKKGESTPQAGFWPSHLRTKHTDTRTCIRIYFPAFLIGSPQVPFCPIDLVYDPAILDQGTTGPLAASGKRI